VVQQSIATLKGKGVNVALSVGGATYTNWTGRNIAAIKSFMDDLGITSLDIDYEPSINGTAAQQLSHHHH
jgi:chitinase